MFSSLFEGQTLWDDQRLQKVYFNMFKFSLFVTHKKVCILYMYDNIKNLWKGALFASLM